MSLGDQIDTLVTQFRQLRDIVRGHDAVHPDRSECGGVGTCRLLKAEVQLETEIVANLTDLARQDVELDICVLVG